MFKNTYYHVKSTRAGYRLYYSFCWIGSLSSLWD